MYCLDDEIGVVDLVMLVVVELDMLVVCCRQGMKFMVTEVGKMVKFDCMDVRNIGNIVSGEH